MATAVASSFDVSRPVVRRKQVSATNDGRMRTQIDHGEYGVVVTDEPVAPGGTGEGPSPLQTVLGALPGCESVTFHRTAEEMGFAYQRIDFDASFTIDIRGRLGVRGVTQHFQSVKVDAVVATGESAQRLSEVVAETEARCPVFNLVQDAGVRVEMRWVARPPASAASLWQPTRAPRTERRPGQPPAR
jgi:uncharacterized OsmC-like protein